MLTEAYKLVLFGQVSSQAFAGVGTGNGGRWLWHGMWLEQPGPRLPMWLADRLALSLVLCRQRAVQGMGALAFAAQAVPLLPQKPCSVQAQRGA